MVQIKQPSNYKLVKESNLKVGDFDFDGLPDLLGIFSINSNKKVSILANHDTFMFNPFHSDILALQQVINPIQTALYDFT